MSEKIISEDKEKNEIVVEVVETETVIIKDDLLNLDMMKELKTVRTKKKKRKI